MGDHDLRAVVFAPIMSDENDVGFALFLADKR